MMQVNPITCDVALFVLLPVLCLEGVRLFPYVVARPKSDRSR